MGLGQDAGPAEIEPVGIPTGLNGDIGLHQAVCVIGAGVVEQLEFWFI